jgi:hypothetical protein
MFTGKLIDELLAAVESAEKATKKPPRSISVTEGSLCHESRKEGTAVSCVAQADVFEEEKNSESEEFAQPFRLCPADWYLGLLLIVHTQLIRALEPRDNFADTVDVHQIGAVRPPEKIAV